MANYSKALISGAVAALLSACASTSSVTEFSAAYEPPAPTKTQITEHLECFGDMLADYQRAYSGGKTSPLRIAIASVKDATDVSTIDFANSEIPSDFSDMTIGIVSKIGGALRIMHVPDSNEIVDSIRLAGNSPNAKSVFNAGYLAGGGLQLYGALTEYDRLLKNRQVETDVAIELGDGSGLTNIELSKFKERNSARMTMDFRVVQASVGDVINHASSTNTLKLYQKGDDLSFGISVDGQGIGWESNTSIVDARHKAIRLLIELGVMQSIGRYAKVPYWKCLQPSNTPNGVVISDVLRAQSGNYDFMERFSALQAAQNESDQASREFQQCAEAVLDKDKVAAQCLDNRDKNLMMKVAADFEYAEFINLGSRAFVARPETPFSLSGDPSARQLDGRMEKLRAVLSLYRKNNAYYATVQNDVDLANELSSSFAELGLIGGTDNIYDKQLYLALWANAPVSRGARWHLN